MDLISRQEAIEAINSHFGFNIEEEYGSAVQEVINGLPSAQPEVIRCKECRWHGHPGCAVWIVDDSDRPMEDDFCSMAERRNEEEDNEQRD
ncbi:MAG: hypothetical protein J6P60_01805 [Lachnospiraceae bacterium]|nr:hypothetical protein [Lachnospiraceae bacterium]